MLINNSYFTEVRDKGVPKMIPKSKEWREYWKEQTHRCKYGYTVGGKFITGRMYFYINFWTLETNYDGGSRKKRALPTIRDIDWDLFEAIEKCKGWSGFDTEGRPEYKNEAKGMILITGRDSGKELADYEPVVTEDGPKPIGNCNVGDRIYGRDGKLTTITGVFPQGEKDIYEITFLDGRKVHVGLEHLWGVYVDNKKYKVLSTKEILSSKYIDPCDKTNRQYYKYYIPDINPVEYEEKTFPIHPYILGSLLGSLLGDGICKTSTPRICSIDYETVEIFKSILGPNYHFHDSEGTGKWAISYIGEDKYKIDYRGVNPLARALKDLGLQGLAINNFIPEEYKHCSKQQRLELIQGLLDTDGTIDKEGRIEFCNKNKRLVEDLAYVVRSLGIRCRMLECTSKIGKVQHTPRGNSHIPTEPYYRLYIQTGEEVFKLSKKKSRINKNKKLRRVPIINIEKIKTHSATCIMVDNEDKLFLTRDFIPTHNSSVGSGNVGYEYTLFPDNEIVVSAGDTKFITPTMAKVRVGLDNMPGSITYMGKTEPAFFSHRRLKNAWAEEIRSGYQDLETGTTKGFNSRIYVRTYGDDPMACNGLRPSLQLIEEIGAFPKLLESYNASLPCWRDGNRQFGVPLLIGTGGEMSKGSVAAKSMFYNPEVHGLMSFDDTFDNTGGKIGYFIPAFMGMHQFKDSEGITNVEIGVKELNDRREKKKKDKVSYEQELQYYPFTPKEAFLVTTGNIFPRALLEEQLSYLTASKAAENLGQKGVLNWQPDGSLSWKVSDLCWEVDYPHDHKSKLEGCITIYEHPQYNEDGYIEHGLYLGGNDPYDHDTSSTDSLGSLFIYKKFWKLGKSYNMVVCEYTGRPEKALDFYENVRKILTYYNAKALYENNVKGLYQFMLNKNCLHLLAEQPSSFLRDIIPSTKVERGYGTHVNKDIKNYLLGQIREELMEEYEPGKTNTSNIFSINLIKELLYYNDHGNFDRVIAYGLCILYKRVKEKIVLEDNTKTDINISFDKYFNNHGFNKRNIY